MRALQILTALTIPATFGACGAPEHPQPAQQPHAPVPQAAQSTYTTSTVALPGAGADGVGMDYLAFDDRTKSVWVPAGNTASVDVIDAASGKVDRIEGFATQEMERHGHKRVVGPSSVTMGARGTVYVGNRGDFSVCAIDEQAHTKGMCSKLDAMPDGIAYVEKTQEVWVTTPRDKSTRVLDAATLVQKARITYDGEPEGFAVDLGRGRFFTNLEDKDVTLAIDLGSRETVATWKPNCGEEGPHGLRFAAAEGLLLVACSARIEALDASHDGAVVGSIETGDGVDDFDYSGARHLVYAGAAKAATLTIASVTPQGQMSLVATIPTQPGARNPAVASDGRAYLAHSQGSELIVVTPPARP